MAGTVAGLAGAGALEGAGSGIGTAIAGAEQAIGNVAGRIFQGLSRPIYSQRTVRRLGKRTITTEWSISALDVLLPFMVAAAWEISLNFAKGISQSSQATNDIAAALSGPAVWVALWLASQQSGSPPPTPAGMSAMQALNAHLAIFAHNVGSAVNTGIGIPLNAALTKLNQAVAP